MIREYIKIMASDIRMNIRFYLLLAVQTFVAFLIIGNLSGIVSYTDDTLDYLESCNFSDNCYGRVSTEVYTDNGITVTEKDLENERKLGYFIAEHFDTDGYSFNYVGVGEEELGLTFVSENFFSVYNLRTKEGRLFYDSEYNTDSMENTPVVLGSGYKYDYSPGDKFAGGYEVVGILEDGQYTVNLCGEQSIPFSVDDFVFLPVKSMSCMKENNFVYPTSLVYADDKSELITINDYAEELGMYACNFTSLQDTKNIIYIVSNQVNVYMLVISMIILLLALFCMIQSTLIFVNKNITELLIHMICGARLRDILIRIGAGILSVIFVSAVVSSLIFMSAETTAVISAVGVTVAVFSIIPVAVRLKVKPLIIAVKEEK